MSCCCGSIRGGSGGAGGAPNWIQSASASVIPTNISAVPPARNDLATVNISTGVGFLLIWVTVGFIADDGADSARFWLVVDGLDVHIRNIAAPFGTLAVVDGLWPTEASMCVRVPVIAGAHIIKLQGAHVFAATIVSTDGVLVVAEVLT